MNTLYIREGVEFDSSDGKQRIMRRLLCQRFLSTADTLFHRRFPSPFSRRPGRVESHARTIQNFRKGTARGPRTVDVGNATFLRNSVSADAFGQIVAGLRAFIRQQ